jgi:D-alanyl-D-alanine carboxypeptidase
MDSGDGVEFTPGEKWQYVDVGYFRLGMIMESVSKYKYGEFPADRVFQPLGMTSTVVRHLLFRIGFGKMGRGTHIRGHTQKIKSGPHVDTGHLDQRQDLSGFGWTFPQ